MPALGGSLRLRYISIENAICFTLIVNLDRRSREVLLGEFMFGDERHKNYENRRKEAKLQEHPLSEGS